MSKPFVAILMGSDSDLDVMRNSFKILEQLQIPFEARITSAHRTPAATHDYVTDADQRGCAVFIAGAGMAAHLAGAVAGLTTKPVLGVPLASGALSGVDSLHSTVQMPGGIPVACLAIGSAGAKNAAYLAAQILSLSDADLAQRVLKDRQDNAAAVMQKDQDLQKSLAG